MIIHDYHRGSAVQDCRSCGRSVYSHQGQTYSPLRAPALTVDESGRHRVSTRAYVEHQCNPDDVERHRELYESVVQQIERLIEDNPSSWVQQDLVEQRSKLYPLRQQIDQLLWTQGLLRPCPRCGAEIGQKCENLSERRKGQTVFNKNPHEERLPPLDEIGPEYEGVVAQYAEASSLLEEISDALAEDRALQGVLQLAKKLGIK